MTDNKRKLEAIFHAAKELTDADQREIYVRDACKGDPELRNKVENLLKAAAESESAFAGQETGAEENGITLMESELSEGPGTTIGRYKLLQKVGEGGMGVVYMAEQTEPVTRKIALKIIKLGMDTKQVVARFEAERQALAMMDHPNIAKVLDAGATDTGRPYFVMELVRGVPITEYCDKNKLSTVERLRLFMPVCQAIQHAHQKGIIHRDIKPSNVMVTLHDGHPVPKVIDFGIAKATNQKLTEKTLFTNYAQMIGTPAYMSPEQAEMSGLDVDTRTDVYSLGVLLYELLTGTTPFPSKELMSMGYGEMQKIIAEKEPPKPSTRLSTMQNEERTGVANNRSMEVSAMGKTFQGDLDWIVMKALEKDRSHRYETANGLVADIKRHLNDEPITAAAPTFSYQLSKFARRNKKYMRAAAAVASLLLIAVVFSSVQAIRAKRAERIAVEEQNKAIDLRRAAQDERDKAKVAESDAKSARQRADDHARDTRLNQYVSNVNLSHQFLIDGNLKQGKQLLLDVIPKDEEEDFRGFEWRYLWTEYTKEKEKTFVLEGHTPGALVLDVAFSPDHPLLASCDSGGTIILWDVANRRLAKQWRAHDGEITSLSFSFDGNRLVSMGSDHGVIVVKQWDIEAETPPLIGEPILSSGGGFNNRVAETMNAFYAPKAPLLAYQTPSSDGVNNSRDVVLLDYESNQQTVLTNAGAIFAFSRDGSRIVTGSDAGSESDIRIWNVQDGRLLKSLGAISDLACEFMGDGPRIITSRGKEAQIWNWETGERDQIVRRAREKIHGIRISPRGDLVVIADYAQVRIFSLPDFLPVETLSAGGAAVYDLEFSLDGQWIAYGSLDKVFLHPLRQRDRSNSLYHIMHDNSATNPERFSEFFYDAPHVPISRDDRIAALRQDASETRIMDLSSGSILDSLPRDVWPVRISPEGSTVTLLQYPDSGGVGEPVSGALRILTWDWKGDAVTEIGSAIMEDLKVGRFLAGTNQRGEHFVVVAGGAGLHVIDEQDFGVTRLASGSGSGIPNLSPSGRWFAAGNGKEGISIWDTSNWLVKEELESPHRRVIRFINDEQLVATSWALTGSVSIWDIETATLAREFDIGVSRLFATDVSADGRTLALGGSGSVLEFWNIESGRQLMSIELDEEPAHVAFSPNESFLRVMESNLFKDTDELTMQLFRAMSWEEINAELKAQAKDSKAK